MSSSRKRGSGEYRVPIKLGFYKTFPECIDFRDVKWLLFIAAPQLVKNLSHKFQAPNKY